jgi:hypothetical protein
LFLPLSDAEEDRRDIADHLTKGSPPVDGLYFGKMLASVMS